jgi:hypothetical protein
MSTSYNSHLQLVKTAMLIAESYEPTIETSYDRQRYNEMCRYIKNEYNKLIGNTDINFDNGILGRVIELYCRDSKSTLTKVRTQGKIDAYIPTSKGRMKAEIKTNGGRVEELFKLNDKQRNNTLIVYFSHTKRAQGTKAKAEGRPIEWLDCFKIMTVAEFIENGHFKRPEADGTIHVQPTNTKMYKRFEAFADFERNTVFTF